MLVLGSYTTLFKYFGNGPAWPGNVPEPNCNKYWWTNLLYINNVYKSNAGVSAEKGVLKQIRLRV